MSSLYTCVPKIIIIWWMLPEIWSAKERIFFSLWTFFCPFYPPNNLENQNFEKWKNPGDIIILHKCTINDNHKMYYSWDIKCDRQNFLPFYPTNNTKNQNFKKFKKMPGDNNILHKCIKNHEHKLIKLHVNIVTRNWNIANSCWKEIKQNNLWKRIVLKGNIRTTYIEHKHKNTGTSVQTWTCFYRPDRLSWPLNLRELVTVRFWL